MLLHDAGATDPGVAGKQNQDDFFIWQSPNDGQTIVMGVLDGHGRELGQVSAFASDRYVSNMDAVYAQSVSSCAGPV
jgi:serine/threonine protein phosphatase PrpC